MKEADLMRTIQLMASARGSRLFRNNTGMSWTGRAFKPDRTMQVIVGPRDVILRGARPFHAGLCKGGSDLIGWTPRNGVAQFTAVETKSPRGRLSGAQKTFLNVVRESGGLAVDIRSQDEFQRWMDGIED